LIRIDSAPHLVLLPGLDGTGKLFDPFVAQLPEHVHYTIVHYPGDRPIPFMDLPDYIESRVPQDRPLVVLGESYSGPVAVLLAAQSALDIRGVILVATFARYPATWMRRLSRLAPLSFLLRLPIPDVLMQRYCFGPDINPSMMSQLREVIRENRPNVLADRARQGSKIDVTEFLSSVKVPCLYLQASMDRLVPASAVAAFKKGIPQLQVVQIDGPHFILQTRPQECYKAIQGILGIDSAHGSELSVNE
jgi:pimeloyl-ACP methyl ester carboxylesterase